MHDLTRTMLPRCRGMLLLACLGVVLLVGCATPPGPERGPVRIDPPAPVAGVQTIPADPELHIELIAPAEPIMPYAVKGQTDESLLLDIPWKQRGMASWYGKSFNGRRTASGERFRAMGLTAAHRTLPIPSYIRVRHVASGQ